MTTQFNLPIEHPQTWDDTKRLDWMEKNKERMFSLSWKICQSLLDIDITVREAIDAAIQEEYGGRMVKVFKEKKDLRNDWQTQVT